MSQPVDVSHSNQPVDGTQPKNDDPAYQNQKKPNRKRNAAIAFGTAAALSGGLATGLTKRGRNAVRKGAQAVRKGAQAVRKGAKSARGRMALWTVAGLTATGAVTTSSVYISRRLKEKYRKKMEFARKWAGQGKRKVSTSSVAGSKQDDKVLFQDDKLGEFQILLNFALDFKVRSTKSVDEVLVLSDDDKKKYKKYCAETEKTLKEEFQQDKSRLNVGMIMATE